LGGTAGRPQIREGASAGRHHEHAISFDLYCPVPACAGKLILLRPNRVLPPF
jgi:hypothetical protein